MPRTLGYHFVKSGYGLWLPGDDRGHWSEAWDEQIGFTEPHTLHEGDPVRFRMSEERMKFPPTFLRPEMMAAVEVAVGECERASPWEIAAASIESTHMHLLLTYSGLDIDRTCKWVADQTTKAVHRTTAFDGAVWGKGKWCCYLFERRYWDNTRGYIERHNIRRGVEPRPYHFITGT